MCKQNCKKINKAFHKVIVILILICFTSEVVFAEGSKIVTVPVTNSQDEFDERMNYSEENGYSGVLKKDGEAEKRLVSGTYIPVQSKTITEEAHYTGSTLPDTWYYDEDGYSGTLTLSKSDNDQYEEDVGPYNDVSREFNKDWTNVLTHYLKEDGSFDHNEWSNPAPNEYEIDEDGYVGKIPRVNTTNSEYVTIAYWPNGKPKIQTQIWVAEYSGTLTKVEHIPDMQMFDHYTGYYSGVVRSAAQDTRVYEYVQRYHGCIYTREFRDEKFGKPENSNSECVGEPVNIITGNFYSNIVDLVIPDRGMALEVVRYYNSQDSRPSILGKGWRHNYDSSLSLDETTGNVKVVYPDGHTIIFARVSGGNEYTAPKPIFDKLTANADGTYTLVLLNKLTYKYGTNRKLSSISDTNGNMITLQYDVDGLLDSVTGAGGKILDFSFENGELKTITDPAGRTIIYTYDTDNNLIRVKGTGGGTTQYEYVSQGLKSIIDPNGRKFVDNEYDAFGRVVIQYDEDRNITRFEYNEASMENTCTFASTESATKYKYDENFFITKKTFSDNTYEEYTYDQWGNRNSVRDRNGNITTFTFDVRGNKLSETTSAPFNYLTSYTYDANDNLTQVSTSGGATTSYEYDSGSNLRRTTLKLSDTESASSVFGYDGFGRITTITDAENNITRLEYGSDDNPVKITDPDGNKVEYGYDSLGRKTSITTYLGTSYLTYNANDKIETLTDPAGNITRMKYDAIGNLVKLIKPEQYNTATDDGYGYTFEYDAMDRLLRQIDPLGSVAAVKYDQLGQKVKEINPNYYNPATGDGAGVGYEYDESGRIVRVVNPSGQKSRIEYDPVGNKTKIISANNYNESSDSGPGIQYAYDALNRLIEARDTSGSVIRRLVYNSDNRIVKEINAKGYLSGANDSLRYGIANRYNLAGWLLEKRMPVKAENGVVYYQVTKYAYDRTGKLIEQKTSPQYAAINDEPVVWNTITYTYYRNGKVKSISDSLGSHMEYTYDGLGNTTGESFKISAGKNSVTGYHYNRSGLIDRMWRELDGSDLINGGEGKVNAETFFDYDKNGNITKVTRPEGYVTTFEYDAADRLVAKHEEVQEDQLHLKQTAAEIVFPTTDIYAGQQYECKVEIHPDSTIKSMRMDVQYDARAYEFTGFTPGINGILVDGGTPGIVKIRSNGINVSTDTVVVTIKLKIKEGISGTGYVTIDRSATYTDGEGKEYRFSELSGKAPEVKAPDVNGDGRVEADDFTQVALKNGIGTQSPGYGSKYDMNGDGVIDNLDLDYLSGFLFKNTHLDNLSKVKYYENSTNGACTSSSSTVIRTTTYQYDKSGNLTRETDCNGNSITYLYDSYDRLISVTDKSGDKSRVFYDEAGNRIKEVLPQNYNTQSDNGPGTTYVYDAMDRLEAAIDASGATVQRRVYDANGLLAKLIDASGYLSGYSDSTRYGIEYTYDIGNRIIAIAGPEAKAAGKVSESYTYDATGYILTSTDGNNNTTAYEKDMWGKVTKVTDAKNINTFYTYDLAGNLTSSTDGNSHPTGYTYNSLNKLAAITDPAGKTIAYKYDKEGRVLQEQDRNGQMIKYGYNSDNKLTLQEIAGKGDHEQYLYSRDGSMLAAANVSGVDEFRYTADGLPESRIRNGKPYIGYEYNKNKDIIKVTDGAGAITSYTYDILGRTKTVSDDTSHVATYNYNPDSTISSVSYNTGINETYTYDRDKNITALVNRNPQGGSISSYSYTYDYSGNQLTKSENGAVTAYTYDELNRLKTVNYPGLGLETYTYDNAGNRLSKVLGSENTTYAYDERNRLTQSAYNGVISRYTYDGNGNLTKLTKGSNNTIYTYDGLNRLVNTTMTNGQPMVNEYDAFGMRTAVSEVGARYEFTLDRGNVIAENAGESDAVRYIRGISLAAQKDATGNLAYYLYNAHGDVTNLVDGSGNVLNSYAYDAFGNATIYAETVANRFMYAGEQFDKATGQYYLRARYYDPATSRMLTEDTNRGDPTNSLSLNLYTYCLNNPIRYIDTTGNAAEDVTRQLARWIIANPAAVWITQNPGWAGEKLFNATGFVRDSSDVYHTRQDALQQYGGYNFIYDIVFDYATSMKAQPFQFTYNDQYYRFWAWKGDYLNLGAGAELGIYTRMSVFGEQTDHWLVDTSLALPMTMTLSDDNENLIASYNPSEPQWWITSFNPYYQGVCADNLRATFTVDFSGNTSMFDTFYEQWYGQDERLTFDPKKCTATLSF